jgi:hypothetical protein
LANSAAVAPRRNICQNPNGKAPLPETEAGQYLPSQTPFIWRVTRIYFDRHGYRQILQWLFFEQYVTNPMSPLPVLSKNTCRKPMSVILIYHVLERGYLA